MVLDVNYITFLGITDMIFNKREESIIHENSKVNNDRDSVSIEGRKGVYISREVKVLPPFIPTDEGKAFYRGMVLFQCKDYFPS